MKTRWLMVIIGAVTVFSSAAWYLVVAVQESGAAGVQASPAGEGRMEKAQAQQFADRLVSEWLAKQTPEVAAAWQRESAAGLAAQQAVPPTRAAQTAQADEQLSPFNARDMEVWQMELDRQIAYGNQIFHDDKLLGSTNGVPCAMCHPNAANTHPETYPKYQVQLQRVVLLRDMINWCLQNPSRAPQLAPDDPKMLALEAYILFQRRGVALDAGKH